MDDTVPGPAADLTTTTELLRTLGDASRLRLLALLGHEELSVAELTRVTGLGQSRVSTHLGKLREAGLVRDRREGASSFYAAAREEGLSPQARAVSRAILDATRDPLFARDRDLASSVVHARGRTWADSVAGRMEKHYSPGRTWEATLRALLGLVRLGDVLDVASGDGALAELVAPRCASITCLDRSETVLAAARERLGHLRGVALRAGDMHDLPFEAARFDQVLLMNCLTLTRRPRVVVREAARVLRPKGTLAIVTLRAHEHPDAVAPFDHVRLGFEPAELTALCVEAGLEVEFTDVVCREKRPPHLEVLAAVAHRPSRPAKKKEART